VANPFGTYRGRVKFSARWDDPWQSFAGVVPLRCLRGCAPIDQNADILLEYGEIKREDETSFSVAPPKDLRDWYVRIELWDTEDPSVNAAHWHGVVPRMHKTSKGGITGTDTGTQIFQAVGLEHLLDRVMISEARALQDGAVVKIDWTPPFNIKYRKGHRIKGNRSKNPGPDGVYVFSNAADAEVWNNQQIIEYLLHYFKPKGPNWILSGQYTALNQIEEVYQNRGAQSLW
jgi:hypothetical protein